MVCPTCGVHYLTPFRSEQEIAEFFAQRFAKGLEQDRINVFRRVARYIQEKKKNGGCILDIGCAGGLFLDQFSVARGWTAYGIELSEGPGRAAQAKGLHVAIGTLESATLAPGSCDVITILDSFYYFQEPRRELGTAFRLLKPDGLLIIEIPLGTARLWRTSGAGRMFRGASVPAVEGMHNYFYAPESLSLLLGASGFRVLEIRPLPANQRSQIPQKILYQLYSGISQVLWALSGGGINVGPRVLVAATPDSPAKERGIA